MEDTIRQLLFSVLELDNVNLETIQSDDNLTNLGLDSIKAIEFVVMLESQFNITIDEDDLLIENMDTINKLLAIVNKSLLRK